MNIWSSKDGQWVQEGEIVGAFPFSISMLFPRPTVLQYLVDGNQAGEVWAIALSEDGQYLASTSFDGRINVWDKYGSHAKIIEFESKGSFGMAIDLVGSSPF